VDELHASWTSAWSSRSEGPAEPLKLEAVGTGEAYHSSDMSDSRVGEIGGIRGLRDVF